MLLRRQPRAGGISSLLLLHEAAVLLLLQAGRQERWGLCTMQKRRVRVKHEGLRFRRLATVWVVPPTPPSLGPCATACTVELFLGMIPPPDTDSQSQRPASSAPKVDSDSNLLPHRRD
jgi:hypothetical protein